MKPAICIGVEKDAKDSDTVTVGYYLCKSNKQKVATTEFAAVFSPYDGKFLKTIAADTAQLKVGDIRKDQNVTSTGACPTCATEHFVGANALEHFVEDGNNMFCTLCGTEYEPLIDPAVLEIHDEDDEDEDLTTEAGTDDLTVVAEDDDNETETESDDDDDENNPQVVETQDPPTPTPEPAPEPAPDNTEPNRPSETNTEDLSHNGEEVSASLTEFQINCLANAGNLSKQKLHLLKVNDDYALVLADDQPIVKLYASQAGDNKALFSNYKTLAKAFQTILAENAENPDFSAIGGEPLEFNIKVDQQIAKQVKAGVTAATENLNAERATMAEEFCQSLMVAASMVNKNLTKDVTNPLRDNLTATLTKLNVKNAAATTDMILQASAEEYINTIITQAETYRNQPLEARNTIALFVNNANYLKPTAVTASVEVEQKEFSQSLADNSVMFTTAGTFESAPVSTAKVENAGIAHYRKMFRR